MKCALPMCALQGAMQGWPPHGGAFAGYGGMHPPGESTFSYPSVGIHFHRPKNRADYEGSDARLPARALFASCLC